MDKQKELQERIDILEKIHAKEVEHRHGRVEWGCYLYILGSCILATVIILIFNYYFWGTGWAWITGILSCFAIIVVIFLIYAFFGTDLSTKYNALNTIKNEITDYKYETYLLDKKRELQLSPQERYKEDIPNVIREYQNQANRKRQISNTIQTIIILFSLLITGLTSGFSKTVGIDNTSWLPWLAPVLSFSISFLTWMLGYFKFRESGFNLQQTADAIELEYNAADLGTFNYKKCTDQQEVLVELAERVERLKDEQRKRQQQLEQPSDSKTSQT